MKKILIAAAFLVSSSALACPNLAGIYTCQMDGQAVRMVLSQNDVDGVTQYDISQDGNAWSTIVTDGVERDFTGIDAVQNARYTASCDGAAVVINAKGKVMDNGSEIGDISLRILASVDAAGSLLQNINGVLSGSFGEFPIDEQNNVCARE